MTDDLDDSEKYVQASRGPLGTAYEYLRQQYVALRNYCSQLQ